MVSLAHFLFYAMLAPLVIGLPTDLPVTPDVVRRADISFTCDCIDHWFKHALVWIRASSTTGCMSLETVPKNVYALNALLKPDYLSNDYPNLICSLRQNKCQWTYSPLDFLSNSTSSGVYTRQSAPACEKLDDTRDLLAPVLPFAEGPSTTEELKLKAGLSVKHARNIPKMPEDEAGKDDDSDGEAGEDDDSDSDDGEDSGSDEEDGDDRPGVVEADN